MGTATCCEVRRGDDTLQLVLYAPSFTLLEQRYKLVSFQNIRDELEKREIESWQKLIRVLTHEIMNSVTPIISLSKLIQETLAADGRDPASAGAVGRRAQRPAAQCQRRALAQQRPAGVRQGLSQLRHGAGAGVQRCRWCVPLLERVRTLMAECTGRRSMWPWRVRMRRRSPLIHADPRQIEQVLINLMRNAIEALAEYARSAGRAAGRAQ